MKSNQASSGGTGFFGLLTLLFIALKLLGVINWSWVWVLSPIWLLFAIVAVIFFAILIVTLIENQGKLKK